MCRSFGYQPTITCLKIFVVYSNLYVFLACAMDT